MRGQRISEAVLDRGNACIPEEEISCFFGRKWCSEKYMTQPKLDRHDGAKFLGEYLHLA